VDLPSLLVDLTPDAYAEALRSGAVAAVAWEAAPEDIVKVLAAALAGDTLIPPGSLRLWRRNFPPLRIRTG